MLKMTRDIHSRENYCHFGASEGERLPTTGLRERVLEEVGLHSAGV